MAKESDAEIAERLRRSTTPVTMGSLVRFFDESNKGVVKAIREAMAVRDARIDALTARVEELEAQPFHYDGPHETGKTYGKGTFVTHAGSVWHANCTTTARPGDGPAWTLAVKHGRDAR